MFAERFDALMNIAEVSNSLLGRKVNMNASHIGRLRSGARPLAQKHDYLSSMCQYLVEHIKKDYQLIALQKLTHISDTALASSESTALYLEQWLLEQEQDTSAAAGRLLSGFSHPISSPLPLSEYGTVRKTPLKQKYATYLYGNAGKRKAVEQFFQMVLETETPQMLLLFSDENMEWLYEDTAFCAHWAELFTKVIQKGNRVRIIHTLSRNMNDLLEAVTNWIPIYMTGSIEPFCYPKLRDGIFQHTLFIAPKTAAVISSSIQQETNGMLNLFLTDQAAIDALVLEYERYFALCRPLMRIFTAQNIRTLSETITHLDDIDGNAYLVCPMPPLFTMPPKLVLELAKQTGNDTLMDSWHRNRTLFLNNIKKQHLSIALLDPKLALLTPDILHLYTSTETDQCNLCYTKEQYLTHIDHINDLEKQYENLTITFCNKLLGNTLIYAKEDTAVIMTKLDTPITSFVISEHNIINAIWDYLTKCIFL